jgi:hypothetical protein
MDDHVLPGYLLGQAFLVSLMCAFNLGIWQRLTTIEHKQISYIW